jgi:hypothetical protein
MKNRWSVKMLSLRRPVIILFISFISGAMIMCFFSTYQKIVLDSPLLIRGYIVPFLFGGISGSIIGYYINKVNECNIYLKGHISTLEDILPICAHCKKVRKHDSDPDDISSWENIEAHIESNTPSHFSHSVCPVCAEELYGNHEWFENKKPVISDPAKHLVSS